MVLTQRDISIASVLEPFRFDQGSNLTLYNDTMDVFHNILYGKLDDLKSRLKSADPNGLANLRESLASLNGAELDEFLVQPEISHVLLYRPNSNPTLVNNFLLRGLAAQLAKKTHVYDTDKYDQLWSANGDYLISYNAAEGTFEEYEALKVLDRVPLDFFSPYCQSLSQAEIHEDSRNRFELYSIEEAEEIFAFVESSLHPVLHNENIIELSCRFNNTIMIQKQVNHDNRMPFISGSDGLYIGRTHIMNPTMVPQEVIAETFVHEAIHSVLYILDEHKAWMPSNDDATRILYTVPSNWSGNLLSIRSYFQAVFVWFGIFNFWKYVLANELYNEQYVNNRLEYVTKGFKTLDMDKIVRTYGLKLPAETIDTVNAAKNIVLMS